jgi:hypothetical protein
MAITINHFTKTKKNRLNFDPSIWGKKAWPFLFSVAFAYAKNPTIEEIEETRNFFSSLVIILACFNCRKNLKKHLIKFPLNNQVLSNRTNLIIWLYNINNETNKNSGKKTYTLNETINYYYYILKNTDNNEDDSSYKKFNYNYILIVTVFVIFIMLLWLCFKK